MEGSPRVSPPDVLGQASEAATPGASVAAHQGDRQPSALDTPGQPSPGHTSPTPHRSQEEGRSASRGRGSAGVEAAAAAAEMDGRGDAAAAAPAPPAAAEPLSRPRLRVQGADIILEDASSPKVATPPPANGLPAATPQRAPSPRADPLGQAAHPVGRAAQGLPGAAAAQPAAPHAQHSGGGGRAAQSHEHELALRLASRTATGVSNVAMASTKAHAAQAHASERARGHDAGAEAGPSGGSSVEGPVRVKYRSTLTEENVAYHNKLDQYSSRPESSERIWRWLEGSGPPFDNPPPSLGVPAVTKSAHVATGKRQASTRRGFFSCFSCFGGRQ